MLTSHWRDKSLDQNRVFERYCVKACLAIVLRIALQSSTPLKQNTHDWVSYDCFGFEKQQMP